MELARREFLKVTGAGAGGIFLLGILNIEKAGAAPGVVIPLKRKIGETSTICPYDASGCGFLVATEYGKVVNIEGDPDHPINWGAACAKGAALRQVSADNPQRLQKVLYRAPHSTGWEGNHEKAALEFLK